MNDRHRNVPAPDAETIGRTRERMYAYCFPNVPRTLAEQEAFDRAVLLQCEHEASAEIDGAEIPRGVESFRIGEFQMKMETGGSGTLDRRSICPAACGVLLRSGLLYRGVERKGSGC